jgi:hypothetical protein
MNILQRIISHIVPPAPAACGHEEELHALRNQVQGARLERDLAIDDRARYYELSVDLGNKLAAVEGHRDLLEAQLRAATASAERAQGELEIASAELVAVRRDRDQWKTGAEQIREHRDLLQARVEIVTGQLEETTGTIAILQARVRELGGEQLALVDPPPAEEDSGQDYGEEELSNKVQELAYRLVGIFFDGDGPGRRHSWLMERTVGESIERVKAPIADADFMKRVHDREQSFGAGDTLVGDFRVITWRHTKTGALRVEYRSVEKVTRIVHPDEPLSLDLQPVPEVAHA